MMQSAGTMRRSWRGAAIAAAIAAGLSTYALSPAMAQVSRYDEKQMAPVSDKPLSILNGVGIAQNLNQQLPLSLTFTDDQGKQVQLGSYFGKLPHAVLGGTERTDGRIADGEFCSRQGL